MTLISWGSAGRLLRLWHRHEDGLGRLISPCVGRPDGNLVRAGLQIGHGEDDVLFRAVADVIRWQDGLPVLVGIDAVLQ